MLVVSLAGRAVAQPPGPATALRPDGPEFSYGFSSIAGVQQLRNGKVVVVDRLAKAILLVDWRRPEPQQLGRNGNGPGEYASPLGVLLWAGDSLIVHDIGRSQYLVLAPDGAPVRAFSGPAAEGFGYTPLRATDRRGRLYVERRGPRAQGVETQPVLRWSPGSEAVDTAATIARPALPPSNARPGSAVPVRQAPFHARDEWGVAPNGEVAVVHADPYSVERRDERGQRAIGPVQSYRPRPVTDADKQAWRDQQDNAGRARTISKPGAADPATGSATTITIRIEEPEWPATMPPFVAGSVMVSPDGQVWVRRSGAPSDATVSVDVFGARGALKRTVLLPAGCVIAGFGPQVVFVVRTDEVGLQYLRKYAY